MEKSLNTEIDKLRLGKGQTFRGDAGQVVTKALLQSGVSYIGGCQGAPFSPLLDDAGEILDEMGIHFERAANEAGAAAMLAASIGHPVRGAVGWRSIAGTNAASDALSHVASAGVKGGALVLVGGDYGEGASTIQERSHGLAMKSQFWLLDPRPNLQFITEMVEKGFQLSEASNTPVMLELRSRACQMTGSFECKDNRPPKFSRKNPLKQPVFNAGALPSAAHIQEKHKVESRLPAALKFIREQRLNEMFEGSNRDVGIVMQGGMYNAVIRGLQELGLADPFGDTPIPLYVLNVTYPLVPEELTRFCAGKRAVLVVEESQPNFIEEAINAILRRADLNDTYIIGKEVLPAAGEYTGEAVLHGLAQFLQLSVPDGVDHWRVAKVRDGIGAHKKSAETLLSVPVPQRPSGFCAGSPELPVFSALKMVEKEIGKIHISTDSDCHAFAAQAPFNLGNTVIGHGLGLAASAGIAPLLGKRTVSIMGDGGFLHRDIANAVLHNHDGVLVVMNNGHEGVQAVLRGIGVTWLRAVSAYDVGNMAAALREALHAPGKGVKVIIAEGRLVQKTLAGHEIHVGIDEDLCTSDCAVMRLSGCPSLTLTESPDPLHDDPVTAIDSNCTGCGACGEVAQAASLSPSLYKTEIVRDAGWLDRALDRLRRGIIGSLQGNAPEGTS